MQTKKFITALYGRTSKDDDRRVTIEIQQKSLRDWSTSDPLVDRVFDQYWDDGVTGKLPLGKRPEGKRLMEDVQAGRIQSVAVAYVDRFGRTLLDGLQAAADLEKYKVKVVAVQDGWDARRDDDPLYFQFRLMLAEAEHRRISERMNNGKLRAMERDNAPPGGPVVFGYCMDSHGQYVLDPGEARIVKHIFEMKLEGYSHQQILTWFKSTGVRAGLKFQKRLAGTPPVAARNHLEAELHLSKIRKILSNRVYIGERKWGDRVFPCPPIVDQETFDKVQRLLEGSINCGRKFGDGSKGLVTGLFTCGKCGAVYYFKSEPRQRTSGKVVPYSRYINNSARRDWSKGCKSKTIPVEQLDADVWALVESYLKNPEAIVRRVIAENEKLHGEVTDFDTLENKYATDLGAVDREVAETWKMKDANHLDMSFVAERLKALHSRCESIKKNLVDIRSKRSAIMLNQDQSEKVASALATIRNRLEAGLSQREKFEIVRLVLAGGVIKTIGSSQQKKAEITVQLKWGERLGDSYPKVPKD